MVCRLAAELVARRVAEMAAMTVVERELKLAVHWADESADETVATLVKLMVDLSAF